MGALLRDAGACAFPGVGAELDAGFFAMPLPQPLCNRDKAGEWLNARECVSIGERTRSGLADALQVNFVALMSTNIKRTHLGVCSWNRTLCYFRQCAPPQESVLHRDPRLHLLAEPSVERCGAV